MACLSACWLFGGRPDQVGPVLEEALATLEAMQAWRALTSALNTRAAYLIYIGRRQEGLAVLSHASRLAGDDCLVQFEHVVLEHHDDGLLVGADRLVDLQVADTPETQRKRAGRDGQRE